jgi:hypothetical protein
MSLPASVNYDEPMFSLPEGSSFEFSATPVNGSVFGPSSQIIVDLGNVGFLDPKSLFFRYSITYTAGITADPKTVGTPAYTPFSRLDTLVNSQTIETVNLYGVVSNLYTNLQLSISDKMGNPALGYQDGLTNQNTDGATIPNVGTTATSAPQYMSAPLLGILGNCDKLIPLFLLNQTRVVLTLDSVANVASNITLESTSLVNFAISNFEICYNCVQMGSAVEREIMMSPKLRLKSTSYATSTAPQIASGTSGSLSMQFNMRYASVRSAILISGGTSATFSANKNYDSYDLTSGNGDYQFNIGGIGYPQKPISTINNKAGVISELRKVVGSIFGSTVSMAISREEFNKAQNSATSVVLPAKFWVGTLLMRLIEPSRSLFNGVSTQLSPINVNVNINTATTQAINPTLVLLYDAVIEIDSMSRQVTMVQ